MSQKDPESLAERYAADVAAKRAQIEVGRQRLVDARARDLAESEAFALAQIRLRTDREAAQQAEALADAERKAELAAIERRSADLESARIAKARAEAEEAVRSAMEARTRAQREAEEAANALLAARQLETEALNARRQSLKEMKLAVRGQRLARVKLFWVGVGLASPWKVALVTLILGAGVGYLWAQSQGPRAVVSHGVSRGDELPLRLEQTLTPR